MEPCQPHTPIPDPIAASNLGTLGKDLTKEAQAGHLHPVVGREREIGLLEEILNQDRGANPILTGPSGVGKTQIVEGLALLIAKGKTQTLNSKRIVELKVNSLIEGTGERGELEARIRQLVDEASTSDVILFIDEIHTLFSANADSSLYLIAQALKIPLGRGQISCIGATTTEEFHRFTKNDKALCRRFSEVPISSLSAEATLKVLQLAVSKASVTRSGSQVVKCAPSVLNSIVSLTTIYMRERPQPEASLAVLDKALGKARARELDEISQELVGLAVSDISHVSLDRIMESNGAALLRLEDQLKKTIKGQEDAIGQISKKVRGRLTGPSDRRTPLVLLFLGPSGVGKTLMAETLAKELFVRSPTPIRFDMGQLIGAHQISEIIGSPPGYIASENAGALSEALRKHPECVVLLDEVEKAHPQILDLFLGMFDKGTFRDNQGRESDCCRSVFVLTSNLARDQVSRHFRPEFCNRISLIVEFQPLAASALLDVLDQYTSDNNAQGPLQRAGVQIVLNEGAKELLIAGEKAMAPSCVRSLHKRLETEVFEPIKDQVHAGTIADGTMFVGGGPDGIESFFLKRESGIRIVQVPNGNDPTAPIGYIYIGVGEIGEWCYLAKESNFRIGKLSQNGYQFVLSQWQTPAMVAETTRIENVAQAAVAEKGAQELARVSEQRSVIVVSARVPDAAHEPLPPPADEISMETMDDEWTNHPDCTDDPAGAIVTEACDPDVLADLISRIVVTSDKSPCEDSFASGTYFVPTIADECDDTYNRLGWVCWSSDEAEVCRPDGFPKTKADCILWSELIQKIKGKIWADGIGLRDEILEIPISSGARLHQGRYAITEVDFGVNPSGGDEIGHGTAWVDHVLAGCVFHMLDFVLKKEGLLELYWNHATISYDSVMEFLEEIGRDIESHLAAADFDVSKLQIVQGIAPHRHNT